MKIITFAIYNLKKNSLIEYLHVFIEKVLKCQTLSTELRQWFTALQNTFAEAQRIYHITLKSPITELLTESDAQRDGIVTGLKAIVNAFQKSAVPAEREAARLLWVGLSSIKHNNNDQYIEQTGQVDNLLHFLEVQEAASVSVLKLGDQVGQLRTVNDRIHALIEGRVDEILNRDLGAFEKARADVEEAYRQFVMGVNSWAMLNAARLNEGETDDPEADAVLTPAGFIRWANANIEYYNRKLFKQSASEAEKDDAAGDATEGEGEEGTDSEGSGDNGGTTNPGETTDPGNGGTTTPPGSVPTNPQPGDWDDPDL